VKVSVWMPVKVRAPPRSPNVQTSRPDVGGAATRADGHPAVDPNTYRRRNVVERCINRLKQWRGIATRYDKLACHYQAAVTLVSTLLWINK
jgi:transposase